MGRMLQPVAAGFNKSLRVESRAERLTGDAGPWCCARSWSEAASSSG